MPLQVTKTDYLMTIFLFFVFYYSFFFLTDFSNDKRVTNIALYLSALLLVIEWLYMTIAPGKPRLREINMSSYLHRFYSIAIGKLRSGVSEYHHWRKK